MEANEHLLSTNYVPSPQLGVLYVGYLIISPPRKRGTLAFYRWRNWSSVRQRGSPSLVEFTPESWSVYFWRPCLFFPTLLYAPWESWPNGLHLHFEPSREEQWVEKEDSTARLVLGDQSLCGKWKGRLEMWISPTQTCVLNPLVHFFRKRLPSLDL